ncbi:MAG: hypothetical protein K2M69_04760 [Muribaculaceae bacterium]|nr:hypothetical protein [Muribaculaceae bacterium]
MNRLVFMLLVALGWVCSAQGAIDNPTKILSGERIYVIPDPLSSDGKSYVYIEGEADRETGIQNFSLYDDEFSLVNEFSVKLPYSVSKSTYQQKEFTDVKMVNIEVDDEDLSEFDKYSFEELCGELIRHGLDAKIASLENGTKVVCIMFWNEEIYGLRYPEVFLMQDEDSHWAYCTAEYSVDETKFVWKDVEERDYSRYDDLVEIHLLYNGEKAYGGYLVRGIFNEKVTYVKPIFEEVSYENEWMNGRRLTIESEITGYEVYDTDGKQVTAINLPSGFYGVGEISYLNLLGKKYILTYIQNYERYTYLAVYLLDSQSQVKQITMAPIGKVSPRDPRKGENVTVTVDGRYANEECMVNVVSTEGRSMLRRSIAPGESTITFNTDSFPQGVYIVTFSGKSGKSEAAKIIVR